MTTFILLLIAAPLLLIGLIHLVNYYLKVHFFETWIYEMQAGNYEQCKYRAQVSKGDGTFRYCALGLFYMLAETPPSPIVEGVGLLKTAAVINKNDERMWSFDRIAAWARHEMSFRDVAISYRIKAMNTILFESEMIQKRIRLWLRR